MAEDIQTGGEATGVQGGQPNVQVMLDEREMRTIFTNAYRIHTTAEEVVVDFGFNMANPNPAAAGQQQLLFKVHERAIMSYPTVKRLALSLQQLVRRYEQQFGEIPTTPGQPAGGAGARPAR